MKIIIFLVLFPFYVAKKECEGLWEYSGMKEEFERLHNIYGNMK